MNAAILNIARAIGPRAEPWVLGHVQLGRCGVLFMAFLADAPPELERLLEEALRRELATTSERVVKSLKQDHAHMFRPLAGNGFADGESATCPDVDMREKSRSLQGSVNGAASQGSREGSVVEPSTGSSRAVRGRKLKLDIGRSRSKQEGGLVKFSRKSFFVQQEISKDPPTAHHDGAPGTFSRSADIPANYVPMPLADHASEAEALNTGNPSRSMVLQAGLESPQQPTVSSEHAKRAPVTDDSKVIPLVDATSPPKHFWQVEETMDKIAGILILTNALVMFAETDYMARTWADEVPPAFEAVDALFCLLFTIELSLRIANKGVYFWSIYRPAWRWNYFDTVVVGLQVLENLIKVAETFIALGSLKKSMGGLKVMRVARLFRTVRLIRAVHLIRELHTITVAIFKAIRSLVWTIVLMVLLMFCVSVFLTQLVTDYKTKHTHQPEARLLEYFGTLDRSMLTLYMMISQGMEWREASGPLEEHVSKILVVLLVLYIAFTLFGLTNIVTSVFVESVIQAREEHGRDALLHHVKRAFLGATENADMSQPITVTEFAKHMKNDEMIQYLKAIDLSPDDAIQLFSLVDAEGVGEIPVEEFLSGCLRLQGSAKAIDLAILTAETRSMSSSLSETLRSIEDTLERLESRWGR